jgi:hypothetical protein
MQNTNAVRDIDPAVLPLSDSGERERALEWLLGTLEESKRIADEQGWISQEEIEREFGLI